jgi:exopolysaccharide biosynthesis polyprenyl glycosylphosphotransferase
MGKILLNRSTEDLTRSSGNRAWRPRRRGNPTSHEVDSGVARDISPAWEIVPGADGAGASAGFRTSQRRDALLRRSLGCSDVLAAYAALLLAIAVGGGSAQVRIAIVALAPFVLLISKMIGLYDRDQHVLRKATLDEVPSIANFAVFYALAVWLAEMLLLGGRLARGQVFLLTVASFLFVAAGRWLVRTVLLAHAAPERCIVLGDAASAARTKRKLVSSRGVNAVVIGRVHLHEREDPHPPLDALASLGAIGGLPRVIDEHAVERVIIAPDSHDEEEIIEAIRLVKALGAKVSVLPRLLEVVGSSSVFDDVDGITLLGVRQYGLSKSSELIKRAMDFVAAALGIVVLAPLLVFLGIAVKLSSRGPVFFIQRRIGRKGETFGMIKFRSMIDGADRVKDELRAHNEAEGGLFKISDDPRITRVGRLLRRTSLDELPQLLNVLKADMSLVGPRPLVPDEDKLIEGWQRRRLAVKPGMTGLWQIFGSARIPMDEMVKIDYIYAANWSIWLDLKVLLRTFPYVLSQRGL